MRGRVPPNTDVSTTMCVKWLLRSSTELLLSSATSHLIHPPLTYPLQNLSGSTRSKWQSPMRVPGGELHNGLHGALRGRKRPLNLAPCARRCTQGARRQPRGFIAGTPVVRSHGLLLQVGRLWKFRGSLGAHRNHGFQHETPPALNGRGQRHSEAQMKEAEVPK